MRGAHLLRLYPRAWRARYGEEFLETIGTGPLHAQQIIDIMSGAIDAWLSAEVRRTTMASRVSPNGGRPAMLKTLMACDRKHMRYTTRDSMIGAGVMLAASLLATTLAVALRRGGFPVAGEVVLSVAFPGSLMLSMPFWLMKGQSRKAQTVVVGITFVILVGSAYLATTI